MRIIAQAVAVLLIIVFVYFEKRGKMVVLNKIYTKKGDDGNTELRKWRKSKKNFPKS